MAAVKVHEDWWPDPHRNGGRVRERVYFNPITGRYRNITKVHYPHITTIVLIDETFDSLDAALEGGIGVRGKEPA